MAKELGAKAKRTQIANYIDTHFSDEIFEVLEDELGMSEPMMKIQTKSRVITLTCDGAGQVQEVFKMAESADQADFFKKKEAYIALNTYISMNHANDGVVKDSFENSSIKLETDAKFITLSYDFENKEVVKKERAKKGHAAKSDSGVEGQMSFFDMDLETEYISSNNQVEEKPDEEIKIEKPPVQKTKQVEEKKEVEKVEEKKVEEPPKTEMIIPKDTKQKDYIKIHEGHPMKSIYSGKEYVVVKDMGNVIKVKDKDGNSFVTPRADLTEIEDM